MGVKAAINGFGRVGRYLIRACLGYEGQIDIVAVNSRAKPEVLAHLLKYDSVHGRIAADVRCQGGCLLVNGRKIAITNNTAHPDKLPWGSMGVDIVLEATGAMRKRSDVERHLRAGARKVILAHPGKDVDATFVMGVNEHTYDPLRHHIVSNASCTTNCMAPVVKVLHDRCTIVRGLMTTIHAYTMDQRLLDGSHEDLRRGRAASLSIVPTSTGAAAAVTEVIPELKGKLDGIALRVPTPNVSLVDLAVEVAKNPITAEEINAAFAAAAAGPMKDVLSFCEEPLVSVDFTSSCYSSVVDGLLTKVIDGNFVKVFSWYDNESGYACRMRDLALYIGARLGGV
jgi:glyceraldehyde 3-phosphate dehydrogenase